MTGKKKTYKKKTEEVKVEAKKLEETKKPQPPKAKTVQLKRALSLWRKKNPQRAMFLEDAEAVELFVKRHIPSLEATQEEFNMVFEKF